MFTSRTTPFFGAGLCPYGAGGFFRRKLELTLTDRRPIADGVVRVTLSGFDLAFFPYQGGDQRCTLLIPSPDEAAWRYMLPGVTDPWTAAAHYGFLAALSRPLRRTLTVSSFRSERLEVDFDIIVHGESPLTIWAQRAELGCSVEILNEGRRYHVGDYARWQLLIADETATPAALAIANETPDTMPTTVYLTGEPTTIPETVVPGAHVTIVHVPTSVERPLVGDAVVAAVFGRPLPMIPDKVGIAGERGFIRTLSRELRRAGVPRRAIQAGSYWRDT